MKIVEGDARAELIAMQQLLGRDGYIDAIWTGRDLQQGPAISPSGRWPFEYANSNVLPLFKKVS